MSVPLPPTLRRRREWCGAQLTDLALAFVLLGASLGSIFTGEVVEGPRALTIPVALVGCLAIGWRTRWPLQGALVVAIADLAQTLWGTQSPSTIMALVITLVIVYSVGAECDEAIAAVGLAAVLGSNLLQEWHADGTDYPFITIELGGAWLLGRAARGWSMRATYAEQHQRDLAHLAVAHERARIARELHDVVAHSLSVIAVQADAAEAALAKDPSRAAAPMQAIRSSARDALIDMRQLLHVLRAEASPDETENRAPARGIADLSGLVEAMRAAGLPVTAEVEVSEKLPAGLGLAAFRIAQEGLTNARRHAGEVDTRLLVAQGKQELRVEVHNVAPATSPAATGSDLSTGHGLIGARERVLAAGGTFSAQVDESGGFALVASLPLDGGAP